MPVFHTTVPEDGTIRDVQLEEYHGHSACVIDDDSLSVICYATVSDSSVTIADHHVGKEVRVVVP